MNLEEMEDSFFLFGLLNEFVNRMQTKADTFFDEISWKQCFLIICVKLFEQPPTINELANAIGTSHQNVKQLLNKLEKLGFVEVIVDEVDRRKQRIILTKKVEDFDRKHDAPSKEFMKELFKGISKEGLTITIQTIMQLDENIKKIDVDKIRSECHEENCSI